MLEVRLDKWLWAARFFKTRTLATTAVDRGRVRINGEQCKPARLLRVGDKLTISDPEGERELLVLALSDIRGPAKIAVTLYQENADNIAARQAARELKRLTVEPAQSITGGRPTKQARRALARLR